MNESGLCAAAPPGTAVPCDGDSCQTCGGPNIVDTFTFTCPSDCALQAPTPPPPPPPLDRLYPRIHYTPPCFYRQGGPHDIAGTLYHAPTATWHVMGGCWSKGGWQHLTSKDMVTWTVRGAPRAFGGTGGLTIDDDGTIVAYAMTGGAIHFWSATDATGSEWVESNTTVPGCCNDPIVWKANGTWYALTANHGKPAADGPNYGYEGFYSSPVLLGPSADWQMFDFPFLTNQDSRLVPGHPQVKEFVSPDFFTDIPGVGSPGTAAFLTSVYGDMGLVSGVPRAGIYNFAMFYVGAQVGGAGTALHVNTNGYQAVDWSCFSPSNVTAGGLDVAWEWGPSQYGCCPKTVGGPDAAPGKPRRVMFGWQQNGGSDGNAPHGDTNENAFTLPRDVTLSANNTIVQRFIPELQTLRIESAHYSAITKRFPTSGAAFLPPPALGAQLEISARIKYADGASRFGLRVLAGPGEQTEFGFDFARSQIYIDRTRSSGGKMDVDVRAGPWFGRRAAGGEATLTAYVDHSLVALIVDNVTALSVWVHPQRNSSVGVALFADGSGVVAAELDVWQLNDANPGP